MTTRQCIAANTDTRILLTRHNVCERLTSLKFHHITLLWSFQAKYYIIEWILKPYYGQISTERVLPSGASLKEQAENKK